MFSGITFSTHGELHAFCYAGRNLNGYHFFSIYDTVTATLLTLVLNDFTFTITSGAGGRAAVSIRTG